MSRLAAEIRRRLGPLPDLPRWPLVSIVVLNRDGVGQLRRLLTGLIERTDYPRLELILVDNASSDGSLELIRTIEAPFPISILANPHNESFSDACNQGAEPASGELLLFLNNDTEPFEPGWLRELVACLSETEAGTATATLIHPDAEAGSPFGYGVQTQPAWLYGDRGSLTVELDTRRRELLDESFGENRDSLFPIGACILISSELFHRVGGFTHGFFYGGEDDDLSLKVRERGLSTLYSGRSLLIHHFSATTRKLLAESDGQTQMANVRLLRSRWSARLWREYHLDRLAGGGKWAAPDRATPADPPSQEEVQALGFCLRADGQSPAQRSALEALEAELGRRCHRRLALCDGSSADPRGLLFDVAVYLRGPARYIPQPGQLNVLWLVSDFEAVGAVECRRYDLVVTSNAEQVKRLQANGRPTPVTALRHGDEAADLIDAVHRHAREIDFPTRIEHRAAGAERWPRPSG